MSDERLLNILLSAADRLAQAGQRWLDHDRAEAYGDALVEEVEAYFAIRPNGQWSDWDQWRADRSMESARVTETIKGQAAKIAVLEAREKARGAATEELLRKLRTWQAGQWGPGENEIDDALGHEFLSFQARWESGEF